MQIQAKLFFKLVKNKLETLVGKGLTILSKSLDIAFWPAM